MRWGAESGRQGGEPAEAMGDLGTYGLLYRGRGEEEEAHKSEVSSPLYSCGVQSKDGGMK